MARILRTDASLWKNTKTLAYSEKYYKQYDSIWTGPLSNGSYPTYLLVLNGPVTHVTDQCRLVFTRDADADADSKSTVNLNTLHILFPHLEKWDGSPLHAVSLVSKLLRYRVIFKDGDPEPKPLWYITQYSKTNAICLERNVENPLIDHIVVLCKKGDTLKSPKVEQRFVTDFTFATIMKTILTFPKNVLVAFARSNIFLDSSSWKDVWSFSMENIFLALLPYKVPKSGNIDDAELNPDACADVQDTWCIRAEDVQANLLDGLDFSINSKCADNVIAFKMLQKKFLVVNPARSLITWKLGRGGEAGEAGGAAGAGAADVSPIHHYIHPTGINDMKPLLKLSKSMESMPCTITGPGSTKWLHDLSKQQKQKQKQKLGESIYTHTSPAICVVQNAFQTMTGLVFDSNTMYIGDGSKAQDAWSLESLYPTLPTVYSTFGYTVPFPEEALYKRESYILYVLSKILLLHREKEGGSCMCPDTMKHVLSHFKQIKTIPYDPDTYIFYKEVYCYPVDIAGDISPSNIEILRSSIDWCPSPRKYSDRYSIVCMRGKESFVFSKDSLSPAWDVHIIDVASCSIEKIVAVLSGAWGVICTNDIHSYGWNWALPKGAYVFELPLEHVSKDVHHLSTVAGLRHVFTTYDKLIDSVFNSPVI